MATTEHAVT